MPDQGGIAGSQVVQRTLKQGHDVLDTNADDTALFDRVHESKRAVVPAAVSSDLSTINKPPAIHRRYQTARDAWYNVEDRPSDAPKTDEAYRKAHKLLPSYSERNYYIIVTTRGAAR
ncbi:hypothetical protein E4U14_006219 [Claviceps sp. LM454 group G7]|nr:hypothetical protein E4U14_006219 [Claviceps sp. LM454 group G7]